jgi:hypothetical protein
MSRRFYRTDRIAFTFVSDELNGVTEDNQGAVSPGIDWAFDKIDGIALGRRVADDVFQHLFQPLRQHPS